MCIFIVSSRFFKFATVIFSSDQFYIRAAVNFKQILLLFSVLLSDVNPVWFRLRQHQGKKTENRKPSNNEDASLSRKG